MKKCFLISFLILWDVNPKVLHPITDRFLRQFFSPNFDQWNGIVCRLNLLRSFHQYQALCLCSPNFLWFDFLLHSWQERQFHDQVPMQSESINASTIEYFWGRNQPFDLQWKSSDWFLYGMQHLTKMG